MSNTWLSVTEAAEHCRISRSTIYQMIKAGRIRSHKVGKRTILSRAELDQMIQESASIQAGAISA